MFAMNNFPVSIEKYLTEEAGFSGTELLALRHLLQGEAMTLRELAAKTGKSTGVLDQAVKKLITRQILCRQNVNDSPKITLSSPEAIRAWMKKDIQKKQQVLRRKEQDFESFVHSIQQDMARPQIEYFEGEEGMKKAYMKLLDLTEKELLLYMPMVHKEEEDPMGAFRVQYFRERKKRKIFLRVIGHDTMLGRRYKSRDHFEYRQTALVAEQYCPIPFEKIIAGDTVACFNHQENRACFIHYPELAHAERQFFEVTLARSEEGLEESQKSELNEVPVSTLTLSSVRNFLLSKRSLTSLALCTLVAGVLTQGLYFYALSIMKAEVGERLLSIVATAAPEIDIGDIETLRFARDMRTEEYARIFSKLNLIRDQNVGIQYIYLLRPTDQESMWQFIADADSSYDLLEAASEPDSVEVIAPGTYYDISDSETALTHIVPSEPLAESDFIEDEWGSYLSAYAPILDDNKNTIAILGVDMDVTNVLKLTARRFNIWRWFFVSFAVIIAVRIIQLAKKSNY